MKFHRPPKIAIEEDRTGWDVWGGAGILLLIFLVGLGFIVF